MDYPRWVYRENDLAQGMIVHDEAQGKAAAEQGFLEYEPGIERAKNAPPPKRSPGLPRKGDADLV